MQPDSRHWRLEKTAAKTSLESSVVATLPRQRHKKFTYS